MSKTVTMTFCNHKGGVGKTSTTAILSYDLATMRDKKILLIDLDPQANLTEIMFQTRYTVTGEVNEPKVSLFSSILNNIDIRNTVLPIIPGIDLIPGQTDFGIFPRFLEREFKNDAERVKFLKDKIQPIKDAGIYDYIFIDVPPTLTLANDNAFYACDYAIIVLQTQFLSLQGAVTMVDYLAKTINGKFGGNIDIIGFLPVLTAQKKLDDMVVAQAVKEFGSQYVFDNMIKSSERVKRYVLTGITHNRKDINDRRVHDNFIPVMDEFLEKLAIEQGKEVEE